MSRCFPFPPPGYENKARPNDLNLITKEKDKHKKHKKDKDKKGRSERKDKERAEGKHEDKDRKQKKHKDKKGKKEKQKSSAENQIVKPPSENQNGEKPVPYNKLGNGWHDNGYPVELGKRIGNSDVEIDEKRRFLEEKKIINHPENRNSEKLDPGYNAGNGAHSLVEMGNRISNIDKKELKRKYSEDEDKISGVHLENQINERPGPYNNPDNGGRNHIIFVEQKTDNMKEKHKSSEDINIAGPSEIWNSENDGPYNKLGYGAHEHRVLSEMEERVRADDCATNNSYPFMSGHSLVVDAKCSGNKWVDSFSREKQINVEIIPCEANNVEKKSEGKQMTKLRNSVREGDGLENKNRDKNKEDKKRKRGDKVKTKESKIKQKASDCNVLDLCTDKPVDLLKESWDKRGKLPELKEQFTSNGLLREENGTLPDNSSRSAISSCQVGQNGNGVHHPCHKNTIIPLAAEKQHPLIMNHRVNGSKLPSSQSMIRTANNSSPEPPRDCIKNHDVGNGSHVQNGKRKDNKERGVNGVLHCNKAISPSPSIAKDVPPHPDLKYLSEILIVPKRENPIFTDNDEEWLFGCKDVKRAKFQSVVVECSERVWSDAIRLEAWRLQMWLLCRM